MIIGNLKVIIALIKIKMLNKVKKKFQIIIKSIIKVINVNLMNLILILFRKIMWWN